MTALLLRSTFAMLVAFGGGTLGVMLGRVAPRRLRLLVLAALAGLLAVTLLDVLPEAKARLSWPAFGLALGSGFLLFWVLSRYVSHICPACSVGDFGSETTARLGQNIALLMAALGIHCVMDGVAVVVGDEIAGHLNLALLLAVAFHKLPEGLALALLLLGAGYSRRAALLWTCGIEFYDGLRRDSGPVRPAPLFPVPARPDFRPCRRRIPLSGGCRAGTDGAPAPFPDKIPCERIPL